MKILTSLLTFLRLQLGWGTLAETRLSPDHGWLLRRPLRVALAPAPKGQPR